MANISEIDYNLNATFCKGNGGIRFTVYRDFLLRYQTFIQIFLRPLHKIRCPLRVEGLPGNVFGTSS